MKKCKTLSFFEKIRHAQFVLLFCLLSTTLTAQISQPTIIVTGKVLDEKGAPFKGATIQVKGGNVNAVSGSDGTYSIQVPGEGSILVFSHVGFATQELPVGQNRTLNISLRENATSLTDVVVVAYGKQKLATVTGSVSTVSSKELVSTSVSNVSNMLVGNAAGISGLQASGEPGRNGTAIYIRGISSFAGGSSAQPLIVIDGVEQAPERAYDQLNSMDANEIDNVSILKDASATAVYGIRGANGVIIVTTKRGKTSGKPTLSMSGNFGFTKATNLLHNVTSYQFAEMRNEAIRTEISSFGNSSFSNNLFTNTDLQKFKTNRDYLPEEVDPMTNLSAEQKEALKNSPALYYGSRDLFANQFGGTGPQKQLNLNISGGTSKLKYFTSLGYFSQGSILNTIDYYGAKVESTFDRYNFRSNFDIDVIKNVQISVNLAGQFGETNGPGASGGDAFNLGGRYQAIMQYIFDSNPITAPGLVDGKLVNQYLGVSGSPSNPLGIKLGSLKGAQNAAYNLLTSGNETIYNTFLSNSLVIRHTMNYLTKGLSLRGTINYDDNYTKTILFQPSLPTYSVRRNPRNPAELEFVGGQITGASNFNSNPGRNGTWHKTYYDIGIDYANTFGDHNVTALLLGKAQKYFVPTQNNFFTPSGVMGLVGRVSYNYKERYLADFNAGYNGTEQFIEGKRFGYFPAYSAGWVISNESFFPSNNIINFLKLRGSYGEVGNDQINSRRYLYLPNTFNVNQGGGNQYYFGASNGSVANALYQGAFEGNLGNSAVTWERAIKRNLGLDAKFLSSRLALNVDYFKDDRNNILTTLDQLIPFAYGVPSGNVPPVNVGVTTNHGYEIVLGWNDRVGTFNYYATANVNYARNKIIYRAESQKAFPWMMQTGYPIGQKFGLRTEGFYNTQEELNNRPYNTFNANKTALGDVRYRDITGDGLIDNRDIVPVDYSNLPQYTFGFKTGFNYKGFDLSALFTGSAKGSFNLAGYQFVNAPFFQVAGNVMDWQYEGRWTPEKVASGQEVLFPRATINGGAGQNANFLNSDLYFIRTDYFRLKNLEVGYRFQSAGLLRKAGISAMRLYANGNNLVTFKSDLMKYGIDPEANDGGGYSIYPITRAFVFGANITF
jgi:TonB-linked SusC/RagA family outer membrane protein